MLMWEALGLATLLYCLDTSDSIRWPAGTYGIPKPAFGCPCADGFQWKTGWRLQDTEGYSSSNAKSTEFHLDGVVHRRNVNRSFCVKTNTENDKNRPAWPPGKYCIYEKNHSCPAGLQSGYVYWDDEDYPNNNKKDGTLPDGVYDNIDTKLWFCCRTDGDQNDPVPLPSQTPFFLLAYESAKCQMVKWAIASLEWIYYNTDHNYNIDRAVGKYPYAAGIHHPTIYYCYYRGCNETLTGVNGTFHSPNYPQKYPDGQYCSWRITVSPGQQIYLTFTNFSLQSENDSDGLYVYDGENATGEVLGVYYGGHLPPKEGICSSSSHMLVIFKSDKSVSSTGFSALYYENRCPASTAATTIAYTSSVTAKTLHSLETTASSQEPPPTPAKASTAATTTAYTLNATSSIVTAKTLHSLETTASSQKPPPTPAKASSPTESREFNKDIYGAVIGVLSVIVTVFIMYTVWKLWKRRADNRLAGIPVGEKRTHVTDEYEIGFNNEHMDTTGLQHPGQYMDLKEVTQSQEINDYAPLHPGTHSWEVPRGNVVIEKIIGKGAFGQVAQGKASELRGISETTTVAIKMLKDNAPETDRKDLLSELDVMKKLKPHPHVIKLLGCVTTESEPLLVIIEYVPYGDLLGYLRKSRGLNDMYYKDPDVKPQTSLTSQHLMKFSWQVADGMRYLSSRSIIHRDLAARNVLVGEQERCKVTDFGMARDVYQGRYSRNPT